jgi:A/G-specific adenine glycosylase
VTPHQRKINAIVSKLLEWFPKNARDLPWRRTTDPYGVYVSEIMLQQTQVKTVIPYWDRWMRELPTIQNAAQASPAKLHKLWEGLGYYNRVRNLQKASQRILTQHNGKFPENFDAILALPGIGRYTAGAISSIAFNQPRPILDGNVIRVLTRLFGIATNPREKKTNARLWELAKQLVKSASEQKAFAQVDRSPRLSPLLGEKARARAAVPNKNQNACSHLNQSLMELGALICTPRAPNCTLCPVQKRCVAQKQSLQEQLPYLGKRDAATERRFIAFAVERDGKFLVRQRPAGVVNAHLWEFPNVETVAIKDRACHSLRANARPLATGAQRTDTPCQNDGFRPIAIKPLCTIKHSITRYRITLEAYRAEFTHPRLKPDGRWLIPAQLHKLAFTSAHKKILNCLRAPISKSAH